MKRLEIVDCNICGSSKTIPFLRRADRISGDEFNLVRCGNCGLIYLKPRPNQRMIADYYPDDYECHIVPGAVQSSVENWHIRQALKSKLDFVEKYANHPGKLLDIGCGTGDFLISARERGWEVEGIELVPRAARIAQENHGLDIFIGSFDEMVIDDDSFNVVTMWDVLEHLPDPNTSLKKIFKILKPEGWLFFSIPNLSSIDRYLFGTSWIGWDIPRHLYLFKEQNLRRLSEDAGFKILERKSFIGGKGTFWLSLKQKFPRSEAFLSKIFPILSALLWPYRQFAYFLNRGPIITYVLRKS